MLPVGLAMGVDSVFSLRGDIGMGRDSPIEWTHHTFNPWWGCLKVSPACTHCYAEAWAKRTGHSVWGSRTRRRFFSENHWQQPLAWDRAAAASGRRSRVFCASMADVFEERAELDPWRDRLWRLIEQTPHLDWLLLTKRIERVAELLPWKNALPSSVWIGTTVESQEWAEKRVPELIKVPATVRFLSCEPLLGKVDLSPWLGQLSWVIAGGESGPKSRPSDPAWFRILRDQCVSVGVAFHFKQWGDWFPVPDEAESRKKTWATGSGELVVRAGKKRAGRVLDGRVWNQLPLAEGTATSV